MVVYTLLLKNEFFRQQERKLSRFISKERLNEITRYKYENDKKLKLYAELLAKIVVLENTNIELEQIVFVKSKLGKPYIKDVEVEMSWSHSKNLVVCAISKNPIGVDTEILGKWNTIESPEDSTAYEVWTRKEAFLKQKGWGLYGLEEVDWDRDIREDYMHTFPYQNYIISVYCADKNMKLIPLNENDVESLFESKE